MRSWKRWEKETRTAEYQFSHGQYYILQSYNYQSPIANSLRYKLINQLELKFITNFGFSLRTVVENDING